MKTVTLASSQNVSLSLGDASLVIEDEEFAGNVVRYAGSLRLSSQSCANCARITVIINVAVSRTSCEGFSFGLHLDPLYLPAGAHLF
jgi:hypothetical protein